MKMARHPSNKPSEPKDGWIEVDGLRIHYLRLGLRNRWIILRASLFFGSDRRAVEGKIDEILKLAVTPDMERAFLSWLRSEFGPNGVRSNFVERLQEKRVPTLILHGARDRLISVSHAYRARTLIEGSELHVIPECGHLLPRECKGRFIRVVSDFLLEKPPP
ncbi:MAG: alpha/beta hydrolase [Bacillota bacterium]